MEANRDKFEIEREIYHTQWINIRNHWDQTFLGVRYLSTLVLLAIIPMKFLRVKDASGIHLSVDPSVEVYIKAFVIVIIALMGIVTFLYQYNHHVRSKEARKVVVAIEQRWGLYDEAGRFIFQEPGAKIQYQKFSGGEKRLTHTAIVFIYIVLITLTGVAFVLFA
ncbi:hypothetical protein HNR65_002251 [Desulfosalsimonas propionicica]|uniref:Uncharacterized protein n=1 Tax=Desulfosalsimonas propionicica TaxID=332175 RepID=A0A7W0CA13_9BACT|nr:hypothetical protein [Desulfosalsimonas propionicica]MBA2881917.1 hypothetical protein [Desulfosalsimonas propionicica]